MIVWFNPSVLADTSPIFCVAKHPVMLRGTAEEEGEMYSPFAFAPILYVTPCNVTEHGRGRSFEVFFYYVIFVGEIRSI